MQMRLGDARATAGATATAAAAATAAVADKITSTTCDDAGGRMGPASQRARTKFPSDRFVRKLYTTSVFAREWYHEKVKTRNDGIIL